MAKRMKSVAPAAVTSLEELREKLGRYALLATQLEQIATQTAAKITALKVAEAETAKLIQEEMKGILLAAKPWWQANGHTVALAHRKTAELAGCLIGTRTSNPSLVFPKPEATAVSLIQAHGWNGLLRTKVELDKPAILKTLAYAPGTPGNASETEEEGDLLDACLKLKDLGFAAKQQEEFFIDRIAPPAPATAVVADETAQVAA